MFKEIVENQEGQRRLWKIFKIIILILLFKRFYI